MENKACSTGFVRCAICLILFLTAACGLRETPEQRRSEANSAAGKAGQLARKLAEQADKNGRVVGRQMMKAAHDAHEGWKEQSRKEQGKK